MAHGREGPARPAWTEGAPRAPSQGPGQALLRVTRVGHGLQAPVGVEGGLGLHFQRQFSGGFGVLFLFFLSVSYFFFVFLGIFWLIIGLNCLIDTLELLLILFSVN